MGKNRSYISIRKSIKKKVAKQNGCSVLDLTWVKGYLTDQHGTRAWFQPVNANN